MPPFILHAQIGSWPLVRRWRDLPVACESIPRLVSEPVHWPLVGASVAGVLPVGDDLDSLATCADGWSRFAMRAPYAPLLRGGCTGTHGSVGTNQGERLFRLQERLSNRYGSPSTGRVELAA